MGRIISQEINVIAQVRENKDYLVRMKWEKWVDSKKAKKRD